MRCEEQQRESLAASPGACIRTTREMRFRTHGGVVDKPVGTPGVITSVGEGGAPVWAKIAGYTMEMLPGEYEVVAG